MAKFVWEAVGRGGESRRGTMEAPDAGTVNDRLRNDGLTPKSVKKDGGFSLGNINIAFGSGVTPKDLQIFTRQLATMVDAGLPLVQCMDILANQSENKQFAKVLFGVKHSVESGATFSDSLRKYPKIFDELYVNLVAAGEAGGILDAILVRLAVYIEKNVKLKGQLKSAMVYPTVVLLIAAGVIAVMMLKVIPVFEDMYKQFAGAKLPEPTKVVISISNAFAKWWYLIFGSFVALVMGITALARTDRGREFLDRLLLRLPVIGGVLRKIAVARFTRTLGTLLSSGVPILDALDICAKTAGNRVIQRGLLYTRGKISEGYDMAGPLSEAKVFPGMVIQMIGVGEQTGAMDQMLTKIADFYEEEVDAAVSGMTAMIEPMMMAFLGVVVGGIIVAMYLPIFDLAGNINAN